MTGSGVPPVPPTDMAELPEAELPEAGAQRACLRLEEGRWEVLLERTSRQRPKFRCG